MGNMDGCSPYVASWNAQQGERVHRLDMGLLHIQLVDTTADAPGQVPPAQALVKGINDMKNEAV